MNSQVGGFPVGEVTGILNGMDSNGVDPATGDLLPNLVHMDDISNEEIDLLDDFLGIEDWKDLEPTLTPEVNTPNPGNPLMPNQGLPQQKMSVNLKPILPAVPIQPAPLVQNQTHHLSQYPPIQPAPGPVATSNIVSTTNGSMNHNIITTTTPMQSILSSQLYSLAPVSLTPVILPFSSLATTENEKLNKRQIDSHPKSKTFGKKDVRRSSHNAIEKRYRSSINDKILELKNLVCRPSEPTEKVHKAAILKNSIDTIKKLQQTNQRLENELRAYRQRKCIHCNGMNPQPDLRELLSSPPHTSGESSSDFSLPSSPSSGVDSPESQTQQKSPMALFAIAAGLFLINPISISSHSHDHYSGPSGHGSRVERSVGVGNEYIEEPYGSYSAWTGRLIALMVNFILFLIIYFLSGKFFGPGKRPFQRRFSACPSWDYVDDMKHRYHKALKNQNLVEKKKKLEDIVKDIAGISFPHSNLTLKVESWFQFYVRTPWVVWRYDAAASSKVEQKLHLLMVAGKACTELGSMEGLKNYLYALRGLPFALQLLNDKSSSQVAEELVLTILLLTRSKWLLRLLLWKLKGVTRHPLLASKLGLPFFQQNVVGSESALTSLVTSCIGGNNPLSLLMHQYKDSMMNRGIAQLFYLGEGSVDFFKAALQAVYAEQKKMENEQDDENMTEVRDDRCKWWACILWCEAEWLSQNCRQPVLDRLFKIVDSTWRDMDKDSDMVIKSVYYSHCAKRLLRQVQNGDLLKIQRLLDSSSMALRDSINLTTDKPKPVVQLIWSLAAEWILERRWELWEEMHNHTEQEYICQFSRDLDILRSLTHYVPSSLPSLFLYEATLRLMSKAAPGRTQQLLDASLRSVRVNQRGGLICINDSSASPLSMDDNESSASCHKKRRWNLIREKRKAIALYLRCKHLPSQVITCPGEKAGMLREALKAMEKFGDHKRINECLEMIKSLGHNVTLH